MICCGFVYVNWKSQSTKKDAVLTNSMAYSPQTIYTDWATAAGKWVLVQTFADRGVSRGQRGWTHTAINLSFLDWSHYFFFQVAPHLSSRGWVGPIIDPLLLRKSDSAENRTRHLWTCSQELWPLDYMGS
jgi:hypothetical protein